MEGQTLSHYRVLERLGGGGMGVVYKALDTRLDRPVALKFLPPELTRDDDARRRFIQEAKAASALDHPNICTIYEIDSTPDGRLFIAMSFVDGETLKKKIERGRLSVDEAVDIATQMAQGLAKAHGAGIIHRDIKPANLMITKDGVVKIVDFGIAKLLGVTGPTQTGTTLGTVAYMSPEQILGEDATPKSDLWALGVVLYEMLAGATPFRGDRQVVVMNAIVDQPVKPIGTVRPEAPDDVERVVMRALEKKPEARPESASELLRELAACRMRLTSVVTTRPGEGVWSLIRRPRVAVALVTLLALAGIGAAWAWNRSANVRWAREEALPQVRELIATDSYREAFELAELASIYIGDDPQLTALWPQMATSLSITSSPPGARVLVAPYQSAGAGWLDLGVTPIENKRVPRGHLRVRVSRDGYDTLERMVAATFLSTTVDVALIEAGAIPPEMVQIPAGNFRLDFAGYDRYQQIPGPSFLLDRYEVTNREYKEFIEAGAYRDRGFWPEEFVRDRRVLSWEEGMAEFLDATGRAGPATWELGTYSEGDDTHPVTGVSWYEATAYCRFAGKILPSIYHWARPADQLFAQVIIPLSNFRREGPAPVGAGDAINGFGVFDMAGNAKEWSSSSAGDLRYILGGAWSDASYMFTHAEARAPFDRSPTNGFRCAKYDGAEPVPQPLLADVPLLHRDYSQETPVSDDIFQIYRTQFAYDRTELNAVSESTSDLEHWIREKVSFDGAYGERMSAYVFLPKAVKPPYQTLVYFPGATPVFTPSSDTLSGANFDFLMMSGRAVMFPIYKGTFERNDGLTSVRGDETNRYKDYFIKWVKDLSRSIDYLDSRDDVDQDRVAFYGVSWGARLGSAMLAVNGRFKIGVLAMGGLETARTLPEVDLINFAPRVTVPVLMLNGDLDHIYPLEASQKPLFQFLGTPPEHKQHVIYPGVGHDMFGRTRNQVIREILDWLDKYLGPVN